MKRLSVVLALAIVYGLCSPLVASGQVEPIRPDPLVGFSQNEVDEFTGEAIVQTNFEPFDVEEHWPETLYTHKLSVFYSEGTWIMALSTTSKSWAFLSSDVAYFLIDGERYQAPVDQGDSNTSGNRVMETTIIDLTPDVREALDEAETFRARIGRYVLDLEEAIKHYRAVKGQI